MNHIIGHRFYRWSRNSQTSTHLGKFQFLRAMRFWTLPVYTGIWGLPNKVPGCLPVARNGFEIYHGPVVTGWLQRLWRDYQGVRWIFTGHWKATGLFFGTFIWSILYKHLNLKGGGTGRRASPVPPLADSDFCIYREQ